MSDIRWLVLSDLHLGEKDSLLTPLDDRGKATLGPEPSAVTTRLVEALAELVGETEEPPGVVLNGDALGLAFASMPEALALFRDLARGLLGPDGAVCREIVYLPGNHDHHIWEIAREARYAATVGECPDQPPPIFHTTEPSVQAGLACPPLGAVVGERLAGSVRIVYPNLLLQAGSRRVLVHHGHFAERMYQFTGLARRALYPERPPIETVEQLEGENFAWIDFVWSLLGRSGDASDDFEQLFHTLATPDHLEREADRLATRIAAAVDFPYLPFEMAERVLARTLLERTASLVRSERRDAAEVCSEETLEGLRQYLDGPCRRQLERLGGVDGATIVWGHTHKPFEKTVSMTGDREVAVYNSGGWTIDSHAPAPLKGAAVVVLSNELEVASLRLYNDDEDGGQLRLEVASAGETDVDFAARLTARVRPDGSPTDAWASFGEAARAEMRRRRTLHAERCGERDG